ncbi:hypothetical protein, partial [Pseudoalteromonas sp. P1-9]|uniref:hypothetical protein n=1 Tax=Pseudoalteromonas sp. P1-9 TaxID=1710354 RepID=UPI000ACF6AE3
HNDNLQARDNDSLSFSDVGNFTYSPISFLNLEGFLYFLPGLARLAGGKGSEYFLDKFLVYLDNDKRRAALSKAERIALFNYLLFIQKNISDCIEYNLDTEELGE